MTRPRIVILVPPDILGGRRRLFERFSDAVTHRADRLFPEAETVCRRGPTLDIAVTGLAEEDADQTEIILAELAAALEELLEADDSWWDETERRKADGAGEDGPDDGGAAGGAAKGEGGPEDGDAPDAAGAGGGSATGQSGAGAESAAGAGGGGGVPDDGRGADDAGVANDGAAKTVETAEESARPARPCPDGPTERPAPEPAGLAQAAPDVSPAAGVEADAFPPEGSLLRRTGRSWLALFPAWGVSVRLEERQDGLVGAVTRLLPGAVPSAGAWARLTGGRGRAVAWDKAPPAVLAALRAMVRPADPA